MSLLGFDAVGRFALGQLPEQAQHYILNVSTASFTVSASSVSFKMTEPVSAASVAVTANAVTEPEREIVAAAAFSVSTTGPTFPQVWSIASASIAVSVSPVIEAETEPVAPVSFAIAFTDVPLFWTGAGVDTSFTGGIGHFKMEMEEARRLAAITRRGPPGFLDLRSQPTATPFGGPQIAPQPPAPDLSAIAAQAAQAQARAAKQRRDIEAILLLAA